MRRAVASRMCKSEFARVRLAAAEAAVCPASVAALVRGGIWTARDFAGVMLTVEAVWKAGMGMAISERLCGRGGRERRLLGGP